MNEPQSHEINELLLKKNARYFWSTIRIFKNQATTQTYLILRMKK